MILPINLIIYISLIGAVALLAYYLVYTVVINKRIRSGEVDGTRLPMMPIPKMVISILIIVLILFGIIVSRGLVSANSIINSYTRNNYSVIDVTDSKNYNFMSFHGEMTNADASYAQIYSMEENPGYEKETKEEGDYRFTIFTRVSGRDDFHPDFLCFAEYIGTADKNLALYSEGMFSGAKDDTDIAGSSFGGGNIVKRMLYIGNLDENVQFKLSLDLLDEDGEQKYREADQKAMEEDKGDFPKVADFATSSAEVLISLQN